MTFWGTLGIALVGGGVGSAISAGVQLHLSKKQREVQLRLAKDEHAFANKQLTKQRRQDRIMQNVNWLQDRQRNAYAQYMESLWSVRTACELEDRDAVALAMLESSKNYHAAYTLSLPNARQALYGTFRKLNRSVAPADFSEQMKSEVFSNVTTAVLAVELVSVALLDVTPGALTDISEAQAKPFLLKPGDDEPMVQ